MMLMENDNKNYYEVLEVPTTASLQDIHNAYRRAKNAYSGDSVALYSLMTNHECEAILQQIEEAYSILGVPEKRREYDKVRGFNQAHTPEGFIEEINNRPEYAPRSGLTDLLSQTQNHAQTHAQTHHHSITQQPSMENMQQNQEDFQYNQIHSPKNEVAISKVAAYKKFGLNYQIDPEFEQEIENSTEYTGPFLQKIREYKGVTVERMSDMTKISKTYIRNIESDNHPNLPAEVYTRGFVYQYAKCLKLNPDLVATSYLHHIKQLKSGE